MTHWDRAVYDSLGQDCELSVTHWDRALSDSSGAGLEVTHWAGLWETHQGRAVGYSSLSGCLGLSMGILHTGGQGCHSFWSLF